jgi:hypothetical protein
MSERFVLYTLSINYMHNILKYLQIYVHVISYVTWVHVCKYG